MEKAFLLAAGAVEIVRKVFRPGVDCTGDIEGVNRALSDLREDREAGLYSSELGKQEYREACKRLDGDPDRRDLPGTVEHVVDPA
ncbi:hypothetical protein ABTZ21_23265 [Streptomyces sp. NPDC096191]|uniref:hypothetical protein n=1 Tax=Streptomyces sp. NPDC096191 TaxID=3155426 RepID=UPI0033319106